MSTDPKLIEAVARALCIANGADPDSNISHLAGDKAWHAHESDAATAITAYEAARGDGVVQTEPVGRRLPDRWRIGQKVRYLRDADFAWGKGDTAYVTELRPEYSGRPAAEYQVFYTGPKNRSATFWTTPNDVELVEDAHPAMIAAAKGE